MQALDENISAILGLKASVGVVGLKAVFRQGSLWNSGPSQPQLLAAMPSGANGFASQVSYIIEGGKGDIGWLPGRSCLGGCGSSFGGCKPIVGVGRLGYVCISFSVFSSLVSQYLCQNFLAWKAKTRTPTKWEKTWLFGRTRLVRTTILRTEYIVKNSFPMVFAWHFQGQWFIFRQLPQLPYSWGRLRRLMNIARWACASWKAGWHVVASC